MEQRSAASNADPLAKRALAIVLMREVLPLLQALEEEAAMAQLQTVIDTVKGGLAPGVSPGLR